MPRLRSCLLAGLLSALLAACPRPLPERVGSQDFPPSDGGAGIDGGAAGPGETVDRKPCPDLDALEPGLLETWRGAGDGAALSMLLRGSDFDGLRARAEALPASLSADMSGVLDLWRQVWRAESPSVLLWRFLAEGLAEQASAAPGELQGLDPEGSWLLTLGDARLASARPAFFSGLAQLEELSRTFILHRFVLPAAQPGELKASLQAWLRAVGMRAGRDFRQWRDEPGTRRARLWAKGSWVRLDLCRGSGCLELESLEASSSEGLRPSPAARALLSQGRGLLLRHWRLREFAAVLGLRELARELEKVSAEERAPLAFELHGRLLAAWLDARPALERPMETVALALESAENWRLEETLAVASGCWDLPEVYAAGGAGQNCLDRLIARVAQSSAAGRGEETAELFDELECMEADPVTRSLAGALRWQRLVYRAQRQVLLGQRASALALLEKACAGGRPEACALVLDWHAQAEPELPRCELRSGVAPPAFGLLRRVLLDRAGRLSGAEGLVANEAFQAWFDARAPWPAVAESMRRLVAARKESRLPMALLDAQRRVRLLSVWLEDAPGGETLELGGLSRIGQGRSRGKARTRVEVIVDGLALAFLGPGGRVSLPAPVACERIECWNLDGLKKLLRDERIARLDPIFVVRASETSRWEQVATILALLRDLGAEALVAGDAT